MSLLSCFDLICPNLTMFHKLDVVDRLSDIECCYNLNDGIGDVDMNCNWWFGKS
jgi:hypothetical protein